MNANTSGPQFGLTETVDTGIVFDLPLEGGYGPKVRTASFYRESGIQIHNTVLDTHILLDNAEAIHLAKAILKYHKVPFCNRVKKDGTPTP